LAAFEQVLDVILLQVSIFEFIGCLNDLLCVIHAAGMVVFGFFAD
jgi:hypothetical protein